MPVWPKCGGCGKESFAQHRTGRRASPARARPQLAGMVARARLPAAAGEVADLGCGEGYLTIEAARWAKRVVAVDRSKDVLAQAKGACDATQDSQHHLEAGRARARADCRRLDGRRAALAGAASRRDPAAVLAEARRILRAGGRLVVLDLRRHDEAWVRAKLGDRWLGFDDEELKTLMGDAGFEDVEVRVGARRSGDPFTVIIAAGHAHS